MGASQKRLDFQQQQLARRDAAKAKSTSPGTFNASEFSRVQQQGAAASQSSTSGKPVNPNYVPSNPQYLPSGMTYAQEQAERVSSPAVITSDAAINTRRQSVTPTPSSPVKTLGSSQQQQIKPVTYEDVFVKQATGKPLTEEDYRIIYQESQKKLAAQTLDSLGYQTSINRSKELVDEAESRYKEQEKLIKAKEESQRALGYDRIQQDTDARVRAARESGKFQSDAVQNALSFSGFGRSTVNADRQQKIAENMGRSIEVAEQAAALEREALDAQLRGESGEALDNMWRGVQELRNTSAQIEAESLQEVAKFNQEQNLKFDESIKNLFETLEKFGKDNDPKEKRDAIIEQIKLGGSSFIDQIPPNERVRLENEAGFTSGFLDSYARNIKESEKTGFKVQRSDIIDDGFGNATAVIISDDGKISTKSLGKISSPQSSYKIESTPDGGTAIFNEKLGTISPISSGSSKVADFTQIFMGSSLNDKGVDLAGKYGSPISSSSAGVVLSVGENGGWGQQVKIRDIFGNVHQYSHLSGVNVKPGQQVSEGMVLGAMGNTGTVLKSDGRVPTEQEKNGPDKRGTHLDYTVYRPDGTAYSVQDAAEFAGVSSQNSGPQKIVEAIMTPGAFVSLEDLTPSERKEVLPLLAQARQTALAKGDIDSVILSSAGGKLPSDEFRKSFEKGATVVSQLASVQDLIQKVNGKVNEDGTPETTGGGWFGSGPIMGQIARLNPYDTKAQTLKSSLISLTPNLARGIYGEVGVLTDQDIKTYQQTLPNLTQTKDVQDAVLALTLRTVKNSLENKLKISVGTGYDVSGLYPFYESLKNSINEIEGRLKISNPNPSKTQQSKADIDYINSLNY